MANERTIDVAAKYFVSTINLAPQTATQTATFSVGERMLETLDVFFAPGHAGLTGIRVSYGGVVMLPFNQPTTFLTGDNERRLFEIGMHVSGPLTIVSTNLDKGHAHQIVLTWKITELVLGANTPAPVTLLPLGALN